MSDEESIVRFDFVVFEDIKETYLTDCPLSCRLTIHPSLGASSQDSIRLFKVGWVAVSDCICSINIPEYHGDEKPFTCNIEFKEDELPKDDGEFYHLCYVMSSGQVRGVSTPFQFVSDDFEVIDDGDESLRDVSFVGTPCIAVEEIIIQRDNAEKSNLIEQDIQKSAESNIAEMYSVRFQELQDKLRKALDELMGTQSERDELKASLASLSLSHSEKLASLSLSHSEKLNKLEFENEGLKKSLALTTKENEELKSQLAKLQADLDLDNQHISQLEGSLEALQIANDSLKERVSKISRTNSEIAKRSQMLDENSTSQRWLMDLIDVKATEIEDQTQLNSVNGDSLESQTNQKLADEEGEQRKAEISTPGTSNDFISANELPQRLCTYETHPNTLYPLPTWFPNPYVDYVPVKRHTVHQPAIIPMNPTPMMTPYQFGMMPMPAVPLYR